MMPEAVASSSLAQIDRLPRWLAVFQVVLVSGFPTLFLVGTALVFGAKLQGVPIFEGSGVSLQFFALLGLIDTAVVALLIRLFLTMSGETSHEVFIGHRPVVGEIVRGLALLPVVFFGVTAVVLTIRAVAPWMHTVEGNPLEAFMRTPIDAAVFGVVVVLAGGIREELQRGFILHRFGQRLGGIRLGLVLFSLLFALLHLDQGVDVALGVGCLGLLWGLLYVTRRSAVMAMVNHAGFNAAQVLQQIVARSLSV
jgi:membrane protease YdiL (CAAX protease family)